MEEMTKQGRQNFWWMKWEIFKFIWIND